MSGVPYKATEQELKDFFNGGDISHRVKYSLNSDGRNSGHAFAAFHTKEAAEKAMLKDKQHMGSRYMKDYVIEVATETEKENSFKGKLLENQSEKEKV